LQFLPKELAAMTMHCDTTSAPWFAPAAYLYALDLDGPALAWEYLRRHPDYRVAWLGASCSRRAATAPHWGLRFRS